MKVIVADKISERGVELLRTPAGTSSWTTKDNLNAEIADADASWCGSATKVTPSYWRKRLACASLAVPALASITSTSKKATRRGVLVMSTPGGNAVSVAEHTFALLLALARQVPRHDKAIHEADGKNPARRAPKSAARRWV